MELNYTYQTYYDTAVGVPAAILVLGAVIVLALLVISCCLKYFYKDDKNCMISTSFYVLKNVYGSHLEQDDDGDYTMYSEGFIKCMLPLLLACYVAIVICSAVAFMSKFLISEIDQCTLKMDCFAINGSTGKVFQQEPIKDNCTDLQSRGFDIVCYRFALDYAGGISIAGGVMVIGTLIMNIQVALWAAAFKFKPEWTDCILLALFVYYIITGALAATLPLALFSLPEFKAAVWDPTNSKTQYVAFYITVVFALVSFTVAFIFTCCKHYKENRVDKY